MGRSSEKKKKEKSSMEYTLTILLFLQSAYSILDTDGAGLLASDQKSVIAKWLSEIGILQPTWALLLSTL